MTDVIRFDDSDFQRAINEKKKLLEEGSPVQRFVDSEVLRLMVPYTPMDTGAMIQSATRYSTIHLMQDICIMVKYMGLTFQ